MLRINLLLCLLTVSVVASSVMAQPGQGLPREFNRALAAAGVPTSAVSVLVQALPAHPTSSQTASAGATEVTAAQAPPAPVLSHRPDAVMNPASLMKLITTYAALDQLGPDFTWKNRVYIDGHLADGVLFGNLILRGSGDPKFVLERIDALFKEVQAKGVRDVRGDIILDRSIFDLPDRSPADFDDEPYKPYNAAPDGLLVNFKALILKFTPDPLYKRAILSSEPPIMRVEIPQQVQAHEGVCGDWRSNLKADFSDPDRIVFHGRYSLQCGERIWPVAYAAPRQYASRVIEAMWRASGGQLSGTVREEKLAQQAKLLVSADSLPLSDIIADVNKYSNNVMAQQVFLSLSSYADQGRRQGSFAASQRQMTQWWKKTFPGSFVPVFDNGSGLSRIERTSASALTRLLQQAAASQLGAVFANSLSIAGVDGTAARMLERNANSAAIRTAQLKTGTLRDVAAIAGYATDRQSRRYSLVAIINHPNAGAARSALDALVEWVSNQR